MSDTILLANTIQQLLFHYDVIQAQTEAIQAEHRSRDIRVILELHRILGELQPPMRDLEDLLRELRS